MLHVKVLAWAGDLSAVSFCCGSGWVLKCHSSEVDLLLCVGTVHKGGRSWQCSSETGSGCLLENSFDASLPGFCEVVRASFSKVCL